MLLPPAFSPPLQSKIDALKKRRVAQTMGCISFPSPYLLAPMAAICSAPFRLLMLDLGAGGTISELISCHGINHKNQKTLRMLKIWPEESHTGIQLFGETASDMARAAEVAQEFGPQFIDINMGCPVKKVVSKGAGAALMRETDKLAHYFSTIKRHIDIPLTIKIRMGWDSDSVNAQTIAQIAYDSGVEMVSIHGRTRAQKYTGKNNWDYVEKCAKGSEISIVGNGDLHQPFQIRDRWAKTNCRGLMIARGAIRNPFIFLQAQDSALEYSFSALDHFEVITRLHYYVCEFFDYLPIQLIQMRKHILWLAAGFPHAASFRSRLYASQKLDDIMKMAQDYFCTLAGKTKNIDYGQSFMMSGHG